MNEISINKTIKLSEHFSLGELCKTSYHALDGNIPSHVVIEILRNFARGGWRTCGFRIISCMAFRNQATAARFSSICGELKAIAGCCRAI